MTAENGGWEHSKQNPGDPRVPEGVVIKSTSITYILNDNEVAAGKSGNCHEVRLGGSDSTDEEEQEVLANTTYQVLLKRGT